MTASAEEQSLPEPTLTVRSGPGAAVAHSRRKPTFGKSGVLRVTGCGLNREFALSAKTFRSHPPLLMKKRRKMSQTDHTLDNCNRCWSLGSNRMRNIALSQLASTTPVKRMLRDKAARRLLAPR
jgi:hypothetical protein